MRGEHHPSSPPPLYATLAPAGAPAERLNWTLACELATMLASGEPRGSEEPSRRNVLLVDAEGHVTGGAAGSPEESPVLMQDRRRGVHVLAYPGRLVDGAAAGGVEGSPGEEAAAAMVRRALERHGRNFDAMVACCGGEDALGDRWLSGADGVVLLCDSPAEGLDEALDRVRGLRGDEGTVLAPVTDPHEPPPDRVGFVAGLPTYPLPAPPGSGHAPERPEDPNGSAERQSSALRGLLAGLLTEAGAAGEAGAHGEIGRSPTEESSPGSSPRRAEGKAPDRGPLDPVGEPPGAARAEPPRPPERPAGPVREPLVEGVGPRARHGSGGARPGVEAGARAAAAPPSGDTPGRTAAAHLRRVGAGVRSLVGGLRGGAPSPAVHTLPGRPPGGGGKPGGEGRPASGGEAGPSAEELERKLKVSLRETVVGGFARVCVGSPKGGVGKSSIAYSLAGSISHYTNMRVCLVEADCDFGSLRLLVPRPVPDSVVTLAEAAGRIRGLSDMRAYVAQHERMRLDVVLGPERQQELARLADLADAYARVDEVLSRFYDVVVYDLGLGFRDPVIRRVLSLSNELLFVTDSEVIPNAQLADAIGYVEQLGVDLRRTTLVLNHRLPPSDESAATPRVRAAHAGFLRRVTEVPYDAGMSRMFNHRSFHIEDLGVATRLGILTTVAACLEGLREARLGAGDGGPGRVAPPAPAAAANGAAPAPRPAHRHDGKDGP